MNGTNNSTTSENSPSRPSTSALSSSTESSSRNVIEPMLIDELVDGSLPHERYAELLKQLEQTPGAWRQCALAFLEDQTFRQTLRKWKTARKELASAPTSSTVSTSVANTLPHTIATKPQSSEIKPATSRLLDTTQLDVSRQSLLNDENRATDFAEVQPSSSHRKSLGGFHWSSLMSMAACTLLAFGVGWQSHQWGGAGSGAQAIESGALRPPIPEFASSSGANVQGVPNAGANRENWLTSTNAPDYEGIDTETIVLDNDVVAELERERVLVPYQDEKGQERLVPIEHVRVRPVALRGF